MKTTIMTILGFVLIGLQLTFAGFRLDLVQKQLELVEKQHQLIDLKLNQATQN